MKTPWVGGGFVDSLRGLLACSFLGSVERSEWVDPI